MAVCEDDSEDGYFEPEQQVEVALTGMLEQWGVYDDSETPYLIIETDPDPYVRGRLGDDNLFVCECAGSVQHIYNQFILWAGSRRFSTISANYIYVHGNEHGAWQDSKHSYMTDHDVVQFFKTIFGDERFPKNLMVFDFNGLG